MMYRSIGLFFGAIQLAVSVPALAQRPLATTDTLRLSLEEAVATGLRVGDEIRLAAAQADIADAQLDAARSSMMPQLRINSTFGRTFDNARHVRLETTHFVQDVHCFTPNPQVQLPKADCGAVI